MTENKFGIRVPTYVCFEQDSELADNPTDTTDSANTPAVDDSAELKKELEFAKKELEKTRKEAAKRRVELREKEAQLSEIDGIDLVKARELLEQEKNAESKKLEAQGNFEKILEQKEIEFKTLLDTATERAEALDKEKIELSEKAQRVEQLEIENALRDAMMERGVKHPRECARLLDTSKVKFETDEETGERTLVGVEAAFETLSDTPFWATITGGNSKATPPTGAADKTNATGNDLTERISAAVKSRSGQRSLLGDIMTGKIKPR